MLLDTSAWVELFEDTKNAEKIKNTLMSEECYTSMVTIAEIANWAEREKQNSELLINSIDKLSIILPLDQTIALLAGKLNFKRKTTNKKWGMMDSFILATSLMYNLKIITKDSDFSDLTNVIILKN